MKTKLIVKAEALQDMTEAFTWYESKQPGLGSEFLDEVEKYFELITQNPNRYQDFRNFKIAVMNRFPYKIVYEIEQENMVVVYAVYHDKRNPQKLIERDQP